MEFAKSATTKGTPIGVTITTDWTLRREKLHTATKQNPIPPRIVDFSPPNSKVEVYIVP